MAAPSLVSADQAIHKPQDLLQYTLLHERYQHWEDWFSLQGINRARGSSNIHFDYGFQSIEAARAGLGIALADQMEVAADLHRGTLVRLLDEVLPVDAGIFLICDAPETQSIRSRLFLEELYKYLEELGKSAGILV